MDDRKMSITAWTDLAHRLGSGRISLLVRYLNANKLRIVPDETLAIAKTQIQDLSADPAWAPRELLEPVGDTIRKLTFGNDGKAL